jgi:gas vesicle protein
LRTEQSTPAALRKLSGLCGNLRGESASLFTGGTSILAAKSTRSLSMKSFLAGLGIGIGLGILFAPMSGEETRENLTQRASDLADSARDLANQGRDKVRTTVSAIRGQADRFAGSVQEATGTETRNL